MLFIGLRKAVCFVILSYDSGHDLASRLLPNKFQLLVHFSQNFRDPGTITPPPFFSILGPELNLNYSTHKNYFLGASVLTLLYLSPWIWGIITSNCHLTVESHFNIFFSKFYNPNSFNWPHKCSLLSLFYLFLLSLFISVPAHLHLKQVFYLKLNRSRIFSFSKLHCIEH